MENATKALMIAAAVLVAVLVISLGIGIFTSASEQAEGNADLSEYEIQAVNDKFKKYFGTKVSGSDVRSLIDTVFNHNLAQDDTSKCIKLTVDGTQIVKEAVTQTSPNKDSVSTSKNYKVEATYDKTTKIVKEIKVTKQ